MEVRLQFFLMMMFCFKDIVARNVDGSYVCMEAIFGTVRVILPTYPGYIFKALAQMRLNSSRIFGLRQNLQQFIIWQKVESWKGCSFRLEVFTKSLLYLLKGNRSTKLSHMKVNSYFPLKKDSEVSDIYVSPNVNVDIFLPVLKVCYIHGDFQEVWHLGTKRSPKNSTRMIMVTLSHDVELFYFVLCCNCIWPVKSTPPSVAYWYN